MKLFRCLVLVTILSAGTVLPAFAEEDTPTVGVSAPNQTVLTKTSGAPFTQVVKEGVYEDGEVQVRVKVSQAVQFQAPYLGVRYNGNNGGFYRLKLYPNEGTAQMERMEDPELGPRVTWPRVRVPDIDPLGWNILTIRIQGDEITGLVNGAVVDTQKDGTFKSGRSIWGLTGTPTDSLEVMFEEVEVSS